MQFSVLARVATLLIIAMHMSAPSAATTIDLTCRMAIPKPGLARDTVPLTFEILNRSKKAINVLIWNTPLEGFFGRYLRVIGASGELEYGGAMVKRGAPERADYVRIKAGGSLSKTINLAEVYQFGAGANYRVEFIGQLFDATTAKVPRALPHHASFSLTCPDVAFSIQAGK